jgi:hypothetical protein
MTRQKLAKIDMSTAVFIHLENEFEEFKDYEITVEPHEEKHDIYFCAVWAHGEDNTINDISVTAEGSNIDEIITRITLALYRKMTANRKIA